MSGFSNNKIIIKNTMFLYLRMFLLMAVSLYTSRVILSELGVDDYGIYNLIGGIVGLFSFISSSLVSAIQRYFNVALGKNDEQLFSKIYSTGIVMFVGFSAFLLIIGETLGLWFVYNNLNIPEGREVAARVVYQISILTLIVSLFRTPDNAAIIAYEKMNFYAYISIAEAALKLGIVFMLKVSNADKLILYVLLYCFVTVLINVIYKVYCNKKFITCDFSWVWDMKFYKEFLSFSGWNVLASGTAVVASQANAFFINRFYSVAVNAAFGVAAQVYNAVNSFLINFQVAFKPQLIKTYSANEMSEHYQLIYRSAKYSFLLMLVITIPIILNLHSLLDIWLVDVPLYTEEFCVFMLLAYLMDAIRSPLETSIFANGNIKGLQISRSALDLLFLIFSFILLSLRKPPYIIAILTMVEHGLFVVVYLVINRKLCSLSLKNYLRKVIIPCFIVMIISLILPSVISLGYNSSDSLLETAILVLIYLVNVVIVSFLFGMTKQERKYVFEIIKKKLNIWR